MSKFIEYSDKYRTQVENKIFNQELFAEYTEKSLKAKVLSMFNLYKNYLYLLVDESNDKVIGVILAIHRISKKSFSKHWWLYGLHVHEEYRRNGFGTILIEKGWDLIKSKGVKNVFVYVYKDNFKSLNLCKGLGYKIVANSSIHKIYEDKYLLEKKL